MITGIHAIVFSPEAEKVRAFFADILGMSSVDAGGGWPIFALPPAELAVHPADGESRHKLYLMCDNIQATLAELTAEGAEVARDVSDQGWGLLAAIRLPDGLGAAHLRAAAPVASSRLTGALLGRGKASTATAAVAAVPRCCRPGR